VQHSSPASCAQPHSPERYPTSLKCSRALFSFSVSVLLGVRPITSDPEPKVSVPNARTHGGSCGKGMKRHFNTRHSLKAATGCWQAQLCSSCCIFWQEGMPNIQAPTHPLHQQDGCNHYEEGSLHVEDGSLQQLCCLHRGLTVCECWWACPAAWLQPGCS